MFVVVVILLWLTTKNHKAAEKETKQPVESPSKIGVKHDLNSIGYELLNAYLNVRNR